MTLDRAWSRRPLVSPPRWGASVPDIWADTAVTFTSFAPVDNSIGGVSVGSGQSIGPVMAAVSIETDVNIGLGSGEARGSSVAGPIRGRIYLVIIDPEQFAGLGYRPIKGDKMAFLDPRFGDQSVTVAIQSATMPNGIGDHWELESEAFE